MSDNINSYQVIITHKGSTLSPLFNKYNKPDYNTDELIELLYFNKRFSKLKDSENVTYEFMGEFFTKAYTTDSVDNPRIDINGNQFLQFHILTNDIKNKIMDVNLNRFIIKNHMENEIYNFIIDSA